MFMMRGEVSVIVQKEDKKAQENQTVRFHHYVVSWYVPLYEIGEGTMRKLSKTLSSCRISWMKLLKNQSLKPMLGLPMCGTGIEVIGFLCKIVFAYQFCQRNFEIFVNEPQQRCSSQLVKLLLVTICFTLIFCINWCKTDTITAFKVSQHMQVLRANVPNRSPVSAIFKNRYYFKRKHPSYIFVLVTQA